MTSCLLPTRAARTLAAAATAASLLAGAASAQLTQDEIIFPFEYELDRLLLMTPRGTEVLYQDLRLEARRACKLPGGPTLTAVDTDCSADLVDKIVLRAQSPELSALHARERR